MEDQGKRKRRAVLRAAGFAALAPVAAAPIFARRAYAQDKLAPEMVMYQKEPKDGHMCSTCLHFQPPNACAIVAGAIDPNGWCAVWAAKG